MVTYAAALAAESKKPVWILEFPDHGSQRFINRQSYTLGTSAATPGLVVTDALTSKLDLRTGELEFGEVECLLVDEGNVAGAFLATNDATLRSANATLKYGFADVAEGSFQSIKLLVSGYKRTRAGLVVTLASALHFLDAPLFEGFTDEGFTLLSSLAASGMSIQVKGNLEEAGWPTAGHILLKGQTTGEAELVQYGSYSVLGDAHSSIAAVTRRKFSVGALGKIWSASDTGVNRVWAYEEDPIEMFLTLATTTSAGTNGTWDDGSGDGLGASVPVAMIDTAAFTALRDGPLTDSGAPRVAIYHDTKEIKSVIDFFVEEFLALGIRFAIKGDGTLTVNPYPDLKESATATAGKVVVEGIVPVDREWAARENNVEWKYGYNPGRKSFHSTVAAVHARSQARFGKSKLRKVEGRGMYGAAARAFGYPDLGWDTWMRTRAGIYLVDFADPSPELKVSGFLELQDTEVGSLVTVTHGGIWDMDTGSMGVTGALFYITSLERDPENGRVLLGLRRRKLIGRPFVWAPNAHPAYAAATEAQKQYGFWGPNAGNFPDGGAPYEWST